MKRSRQSLPVRRAALLVLLATFVLAGSAAAQGLADSDTESASDDLKKMSLEALMEVEVTSVSRQPEKLLEAPSAIQVITGEDIHRYGAQRIPEALRLASNLDVAQKNSHDWGISARGFNTELSNKLLVMIDGRTVYTPLYSGVIWAAQDYLLEDLDRIEVVSGPGGTLWGANAVNGVISIISKSARDTQGLYAEGGGGNLLENFAAVRYGGKVGANTFYRVYAKHFSRDDEVLPDGRPFADSWFRNQAGFRIDSEGTNGNTFTLQGDIHGGEDGLQTGGENDVSGHNLLARWHRSSSPDSEITLQTYYDRTHFDSIVPAFVVDGNPLAPSGTFSDDLHTFDVDFQHRLRAGQRNRVVWGFGYRFTHNEIGNAPALGFFPAELDHNLFSAFVQNEFVVNDDLALIAGTKVEHNDYTGVEWEPSVRMQWTRTPTQTWWAAVSRAVRTPSRIDRDLSQPAPPNFVLLTGGENFASENVLAYEAGWRGRFGSTFDAAVSLFYNEYDDVRSTTFNPVTLFPLTFENDLEGETHGIELRGTWQARDWWRLHAGYALLREELRIEPGGTDINAALNETSDPEHRISLRSSMDLPQRFMLDWMARWVSERPGHDGPTPGELDAYAELDARLAWQASDRLELALIGQNLLHDQHGEYGFPTAVRAEIQRSVWAKASWRY